jgi:hypothetical protein
MFQVNFINFERIASMHPYSISYFIGRHQEGRETNDIWSRITSLRQLHLGRHCDASHILRTQTGLTSLDILAFSPHIRHCTNLLDLTIPLLLISDYKYIPSSVTTLELRLGNNVKWSFDDENIMWMNHLPHLTVLKLGLGNQYEKAGALSSLSRWSSLTELTLGPDSESDSPSLEGLIHNGWSMFPNLLLFILWSDEFALTIDIAQYCMNGSSK